MRLQDVRLFRVIRGRWRIVHVEGCRALARAKGADEVTGSTPNVDLFNRPGVWWWKPCRVCRPEALA